MSTSTKPRSRWSLTSFTLIFTTEARVATDPRVARVSLAARPRMRGATAVLKVTNDALMAAMLSVLCGTKVEWGGHPEGIIRWIIGRSTLIERTSP